MSDKKTKKSAKVKNNEDLSKYIPSDYESPLGIEFSKKETKVKKSNQDSYDEVHGSLYKMAHNNTVPWRNYLIYGILLTLLTCAFTFSKYATQLSSQDAATVAGFGYVINYNTAADNGVSYSDDIQIEDTALATPPTVEFDDDTTIKNYKFKIKNSGDVTVKVTASVALIDDDDDDWGGYDVTFPLNEIVIYPNSSTAETGNGIYVGEGYITMKIDSSSITETTERSMSLKFDVEQVD